MISSLSVAIATHNEAENIKTAWTQLINWPTIIIYDGQSTDQTVANAKNIKR